MNAITRFQRPYAFAVLSLRDLFKLSPFDSAYEWKAQMVVIFAESSYAAAAVATLSVALRWDALLQSKSGFLICLAVIWAVFWWAHATAESRFVHRFEGEFRRLPKAQRVTMTIGAVLLVALSMWAVAHTAGAVKAHLAHLG